MGTSTDTEQIVGFDSWVGRPLRCVKSKALWVEHSSDGRKYLGYEI